MPTRSRSLISSFISGLDERSPHDVLTFSSLSRLIDFYFYNNDNFPGVFLALLNLCLTKFRNLQLCTTFQSDRQQLVSISYFQLTLRTCASSLWLKSNVLRFCYHVAAHLHFLTIRITFVFSKSTQNVWLWASWIESWTPTSKWVYNLI